MSTHYDEEGKFFTDVVSKDPIPVIIQTKSHRIEGIVHVRLDDRIKDELDRDISFIAVTDASIFNLDGALEHKTSFIIINRSQIIWLTPKQNLENQDEVEK